MEAKIMPGLVKEETLKKVTVSEILVDGCHGFGFGSGGISLKKRLESGEITDDEVQQSIYNIANCMKGVEAKSCGCGDGRSCSEQDEPFLKTRSKLFGGDVMMTAAGLIALGETNNDPTNIVPVAVNYLREHNISFGGHTADTHGQENDSGCGAIDRYPEIMANAQKYKHQIKLVLKLLFGEDFNDEIFNEIMGHFQSEFENIDYSSYTGRQANDLIQKSGGEVVRLKGGHKEGIDVLNFNEGTTLNQKKFNELTADKIQAFCVDVWKMEELARQIGRNNPKKQVAAFYGMLIYALGTQATLTDGSQRIIQVR